MEQKENRILPGDRPSLMESLSKKRKYEKSDIEGFLKSGDTYVTEADVANEEQTGQPAEGVSRDEAIRQISQTEGIQNPQGDFEELLAQLKEKKKKKSPPPYEPQVDRPGL